MTDETKRTVPELRTIKELERELVEAKNDVRALEEANARLLDPEVLRLSAQSALSAIQPRPQPWKDAISRAKIMLESAASVGIDARCPFDGKPTPNSALCKEIAGDLSAILEEWAHPGTPLSTSGDIEPNGAVCNKCHRLQMPTKSCAYCLSRHHMEPLYFQSASGRGTDD